MLGVVEGLVGTLKVSPEHQKAIQPAVDLIKQQLIGIWQLREALVHVHTELGGIVDGLDDEEPMVTRALQDMIYDVLGIENGAFEAAAVPDVGPAVALAAPRPTAPAAQRGTRRESGGAAALQGAREVAALEAKGKMAAASARLQSLPLGKHVGASTVSNASRAMEQLLFRPGGLETIGRVLDSKSLAQPSESP